MAIRLAVLCLAVAAGGALAQSTTKLYKSTAPDGTTVYSDRPPSDARKSETLTFHNGPATPLSPQTLAFLEQLRKSADAKIAAASSTRDTVLFSAVWCGYCKQAKAYLAAKQVPYKEVDIDTKEGLAAFARAGGQKAVPLLVVDGKSVSGFSAGSYDALFAARK